MKNPDEDQISDPVIVKFHLEETCIHNLKRYVCVACTKPKECHNYMTFEIEQVRSLGIKNMYKLEIDGFKTKEQVEAFVRWYSGQGEQDASYYFENLETEGKLDISFMPVDVQVKPQWSKTTYKIRIKI